MTPNKLTTVLQRLDFSSVARKMCIGKQKAAPKKCWNFRPKSVKRRRRGLYTSSCSHLDQRYRLRAFFSSNGFWFRIPSRSAEEKKALFAQLFSRIGTRGRERIYISLPQLLTFFERLGSRFSWRPFAIRRYSSINYRFAIRVRLMVDKNLIVTRALYPGLDDENRI